MTRNTQIEIATLAKNGTLLASENGRVTGTAHREEYRIADGRILEVLWDPTCGTSLPGWPAITEYRISARPAKNWRISR